MYAIPLWKSTMAVENHPSKNAGRIFNCHVWLLDDPTEIS